MKNPLGKKLSIIQILIILALAGCSLMQSVEAQTNKTSLTNNSFAPDWKVAVSTYYTAVDGGGFNYHGISGTASVQSADADIYIQAPLNEQWFVPVALSSRNINFDRYGHDTIFSHLNGAPGDAHLDEPIPFSITTLGLDVGVGCQFDKQWTFVTEVGPRFYNLDEMKGIDVGVGGMFEAVYKWTPDFTVGVGLSINADRDVPILPAAGVNWRMSTNLDLSLMFPRSELEYHINRRLTLFSDFDAEFTVFRADFEFASAPDLFAEYKYPNVVGTYRDFHAGAGVECWIYAGLSASVEGGYSFDRELDYQRIGETIHFDSAPYVQAALKYRF